MTFSKYGVVSENDQLLPVAEGGCGHYTGWREFLGGGRMALYPGYIRGYKSLSL